jgi:hypothetical protein
MQPNNQNAAANNGGQMEMYTATFGNVDFAIQPSLTGEVSNMFGTIPYLSLESVIYAQTANAQIDPGRVMSGQTSGQQNIQGSYTIQDSNGLTRMVMGYSPNGF